MPSNSMFDHDFSNASKSSSDDVESRTKAIVLLVFAGLFVVAALVTASAMIKIACNYGRKKYNSITGHDANNDEQQSTLRLTHI